MPNLQFFERSVCRCSEMSSSTQMPFAISGAAPHYAPDRPFQLQNIFLDLTVNPKAKTLQGVATQKMKVVAADQKEIVLDQMGLQIEEVQIDQKKVKFTVEGHRLSAQLSECPPVGSQLEIQIRYRLQNPKRGIYFTGPDDHHPSKPYQVWTQGQDEDSRYWFPTLDYPNQKAISEIRVQIPKGFTAISNGALLSRKETPEGTVFHYRLGVPHVTYLITLVIGEFTEWSDSGPRNLPVQYFVTSNRVEDGKRSFQNTPKMIEVFESKTGIPYPYEKYSQVAVQDFIFGGMENTSATTQTDLTLHDERAHLDFSSDPLVAHELAHQWFGDLVTCRDWSHGWLNEGFATFMERVWIENDPSAHGGFEEAKYYSYQDLRSYLSDDQQRYRRPIVCNIYQEPIDLFDSHLYKKGGLVLNLLRAVLGEDSFWKSIQFYLNRHQGQNVETIDLIRAIEETTGRNLRKFFDQWVFNAGYPEFEISYKWDEELKLTDWVIEQKQTAGQPSVTQNGATTAVFHLPVTLVMTLANGEKISKKIEIREPRERVFITAPSKPVMVRFDPDFTIPKTMKFVRPKEILIEQLKNDSDGMGRIEAAQELAKIADSDVIQALADALLKDSFWAVQAETARALAETRAESAKDALLKALHLPHPKARRAVVSALGSFKDSKTAEALLSLVRKDPSYFVEAEATTAYVQSKIQPWETSSYSAVEEVLLEQLKKTSFREVIRAASLKGLADLPGIEKGEHPQAFQTLLQWVKPDRDVDARGAAVRGLGKILAKARGSEKFQILEVFSHLADEDHFRLRAHLVSALEESGCVETIPILKKIRQTEVDARIKRAAQVAADHLVLSQEAPETITQLKSSLEKLEEEHRKLRTWVETKFQAGQIDQNSVK